MTRDELFQHLLAHRELITYVCLYRVLAKNPYKWGPHLISEAVALATGGRSVAIDGLDATLDSLMVHDLDGKPGDGHYQSHDYDEYQWTTTFVGWSLCVHLCDI